MVANICITVHCWVRQNNYGKKIGLIIELFGEKYELQIKVWIYSDNCRNRPWQ